MPTYEVTYSFDGRHWGTPAETIERSLVVLGELRERDVDIDHLGATVTIDADGSMTDVAARYSAPTEGNVGWLTVAALLPVSGIRRLDRPPLPGTDHETTRTPA